MSTQTEEVDVREKSKLINSLVVIANRKGEVLDWVNDGIRMNHENIPVISKSSVMISGLGKYVGSLIGLRELQSVTVEFINGKVIVLNDEDIYRVAIAKYEVESVT
ncbi:MAG TPA: hypothetical protein ENG05_01500 [Acidilobales archaeon]|nr:MAG: hypothetical protein B6U85_08870 [Desulfurococcales archaeon ex4484_42]HDN75785.1 hypothetical protein [Acidilobales archaeon]